MSNSKLPAGTKAEQSTEDEAQVTSSPNNGNTFVSSSCSLSRPGDMPEKVETFHLIILSAMTD